MTSHDPIIIVDGARTPVGSFGGTLASVPAHILGATAVREAVLRSGVAIEDVDEFVFGCVGQVGPDAFVSRRIALEAGAQTSSTAMTVNRLCGSGLQAVASAAHELRSGDSSIVIAGGVENMSRQPFLDFQARNAYQLGHRQSIDGTLSLLTDPWGDYPMGKTAENVAERFRISREDQDSFAAESQRRADVAQRRGLVAAEIAPVTVSGRKGDTVIDKDEHPRPTSSLEALANLKPVFSKTGSVTAGNSSGINDAGAALVMTTESTADLKNLNKLGEFVAFAKAGIAPEIMGYAPTIAITKVLDKAGLSLSDIGWIELNEAFASQSVAVIRDSGLDPKIVNPLGGAIAWGHPIGATGAILVLRALYGLRNTGKEYALVTLCIGGGQAVAAILRAR
jgi:acetyl-CoA C-acetyltransferase